MMHGAEMHYFACVRPALGPPSSFPICLISDFRKYYFGHTETITKCMSTQTEFADMCANIYP